MPALLNVIVTRCRKRSSKLLINDWLNAGFCLLTLASIFMGFREGFVFDGFTEGSVCMEFRAWSVFNGCSKCPF